MSTYVTQFSVSNSATNHQKSSYIKRKCGDLLYEALKNNTGKDYYPVNVDITSEEREHTRLYSVTVHVIDAPLLEATYD